MANIIGEHFFKYTDDQVKQRQKIYAKRDRNSNDLAYMNGKTAWLKLVSSIDIDQEKSIELELGSNSTQENLARDLVLFGGITAHLTMNNENSIVQLRGISGIDQVLNNNAYGLGGDDFGKRPMPGIISAQVKPKNRGSLREATVQIKAYNKKQLNLLDAIYLRIGYTMLLEWGWSNYYENTGEHQPNPINTLAWEFLKYNGSKPKTNDDNKSYRVYGTGSAYWDFLEKIEKNRDSSNGNYDAMLAKVANFSWEFGNNGTYDITLKLISIGDVVESLKINIFSPKLFSPEKDNATDTEYWPSRYFKHDIGKHLWNKLNTTSSSELESSVMAGGLVGGTTVTVSTKTKFNIPLVWNPAKGAINDVVTDTQDITDLEIYGVKGKISITDNKLNFYYRFGAFLKYMEDELLLYDKSGKPIITIDYDTNTNLVFRTLDQISTFPNKCIVGGIPYTNKKTLFPGCAPYPAFYTYRDINYAGLLMNVYINFDFILETIETNTDQETGDLSIFTFLKNICDEINNSLGNYNKIELVLDEDRLYFIDQTPLPEADKLRNLITNYGKITSSLYADKPTYFNPYGIGPDGGNLGTFVKKFSIKTELTNDFATIVTVGAQANGAVVGEDATFLSKWNKGLTDRIIPVKTDFYKSNISGSNKLQKTDFSNLQKKWFTIVNDYLDGTIRTQEDKNNYESDKKVMRAYIDYINQQNTQASGSVTPGLGFIPLNLNLTCEGISGPKIYQQFSIDTNFLPKKYPGVLRFLIRGITHNIENNIWETTFDSLSIPEQVEAYGQPEEVRTVITSRGRDIRGKLGSNEYYLYYFMFAAYLRGITKNFDRLSNHPSNKAKFNVRSSSYSYTTSLSRLHKSGLLPPTDIFGGTGLGPIATAAIMGNITQESGFEWGITNQEGAIGLVQWLGDRKDAALKKYPDFQANPLNQIAFIFNELNGEIREYRGNKSVLEKLKPLEDKAHQPILNLVSGETKTYTPGDLPLELYNIILEATKIIFDDYEIPEDNTLPTRQQYALEAFLDIIGRKAVKFENPNIIDIRNEGNFVLAGGRKRGASGSF
jgi:hypothetical protein